MSLPANTYKQWAIRRDAKAKRRHTTMLLSVAAATQILALVLVGHLTLGQLQWLPHAPTLAILIAVSLCVVDTAMVIAPKWTLQQLSRAFRALSQVLFGSIAILTIASVYLLAWPWARARGRFQFARNHRASAPWASPHEHWRRSTWTAKESAADVSLQSRSTLRRAMSVFHRQRQYFLLFIAAVLLLVAGVTMFTKSSAVAPFVYTIF